MDGAVKLLGIILAVVLLCLVAGAGAQFLTPLYSFTGLGDQVFPEAPLIQGSDGDFYGTTSGGAGAASHQLSGTLFRITPAVSLTNLRVFRGGTDGAFTSAPLVQGSDGSFYGTTSQLSSGPNKFGTVFKLTEPLHASESSQPDPDLGNEYHLHDSLRGRRDVSVAVCD